jgi:hypothetical protein
MYRRGFSMGRLRNSARGYYNRVQRSRHRRSCFAGVGCLVVGALVVCCLLALALYYAPLRRGALELLPAAWLAARALI